MEMVLQRAVKSLLFGGWKEKEMAMTEIKRMAKEDLSRRKSMAQLGVIQPLVKMMGSDVSSESQRLAVQTLIELANGSFTNKALMVESGLLSKIPIKFDTQDESAKHDFALMLLSISSLSTTQFPLNSSRILSPTVSILESSSNTETKLLCLSTLHNLSSVLDNASKMATSGMIDTLLKLSTLEDTSEKALLTLGNISVTLTGKKALESHGMVPGNLIEILGWEEKPKCQELSAYILMVLAHQSFVQREKMAKAGIVPVLLELALLGSPLAQKRALKLLQGFKDERQKRMGPHSGPQVGMVSVGSPLNKREAQEGKKLMKKIVEQSLQKNMDTIMRRANGAGDLLKLKSLVVSSSSKSLPY